MNHKKLREGMWVYIKKDAPTKKFIGWNNEPMAYLKGRKVRILTIIPETTFTVKNENKKFPDNKVWSMSTSEIDFDRMKKEKEELFKAIEKL